MKRTASFDVDRDFDVYCDVTKYTTLPDGRRLIRGVATGTLEDRDGERVSQRAIAEMLAQGPKGIKVVAGTHQQDWTNEIGDAAEFRLDPDTGELIADAILPKQGVDPLADKACRRLESGEKLGWSIGGKLRKAFFELVPGPDGVRKRKVLDSIGLRHLCLTEKPSYATSVVGFADAVAKTATSFVLDDTVPFFDEPDGQENEDAIAIVEAVTKAAKAPAPDDQDDADAAAGPADGDAPPDDSAAAPPAGTADTSQGGAPAASDAAAQADPNAPPSDAQAAQGLPLSNRHLSCPNCGEEFAAPLPDDDAKSDDDGADEPPSPADTGKTHTPKETPMDMKAVKAQLDALSELIVEKTATEPEASVNKTDEPTDFERMLAVVHKTSEDRATAIEAGITESLELVAKTVQELAERVSSMPQGRRSAAAPAGKPDVEVQKTATDDDDVQKTAEKLADAGDLTGALRELNKARGIR